MPGTKRFNDCIGLPSPKKRTNVFKDTSSITPPVTPEKNRIILNDLEHDEPGKKKLSFDTNVLSPPTTPTKPKVVPKSIPIYSKAKSLFQRGCGNLDNNDPFLNTREAEGAKIKDFIKTNISDNQCNSLYITGPPGTGKTAQIDSLFNHFRDTNQYNGDLIKINKNACKLIKINCMKFTRPDQIFTELSNQIKFTRNNKSCNDLYTLLQSDNKLQSVLIILDEMDSLLTKDQQILYQLFSLSCMRNSDSMSTKIILIGISNSLDLTNKFLPSLKRNRLDPMVLQFIPYTFSQIKSIITCKLQRLLELEKENLPDIDIKQEKQIPIVSAAAIMLCCKKTASITGDIRKAFDLMFKSIELVESEVSMTKSKEEIKSYSILTAPKVQISHIAKTCSASLSGTDSIIKKLNLSQKTIICHLFNFQSTTTESALKINTFLEYYTKCTKSNKLLTKLNRGEVLEILINLESLSVITLSSSPDNVGLKSVKTDIPYNEFMKAINDSEILKKLLV